MAAQAAPVARSPFSELWRLSCESSVIGVATTPNCSLIAVATVGRSLHLLNGNGKQLWESPFELDHEGWCVALSADGGLIAAGTASKKPMSGTVYVLDRRKRLLWTEAVGAPVWSISLSADGSTLAFGSWNNRVYRYIGANGSFQLANTWEAPENAHGIYGVKLSPDGTSCAVNAYDKGLYLLDQTWEARPVCERKTGFYNVSQAAITGDIVAGLRDGHAVIGTADTKEVYDTGRVSPRPICGVGISGDGLLLALGSFDGTLYITTRQGDILWKYPTGGEVWSVGLSADGTLVCVGSGDHTVRFLRNECSAAALAEIRATEQELGNATGGRLEGLCARLVELYLRHGLVEYGVNVLRAMSEESDDSSVLHESLEAILRADIAAYPEHCVAHYELGEALARSKRFSEATHHFQHAARSSSHRTRGLTRAGDVLHEVGLDTAAASCFRRARESTLDSDAQMILYNLGRSYEDQGLWSEAARQYELLVAWDARYRDTWARLEKLRSLYLPDYTETPWEKVDYTGLTASLLGPDMPRVREVDEALLPVVLARTAEILMAQGERARMIEVVRRLSEESGLNRSAHHDQLDYTIEMFLKYDYLLPEDELIKLLEAAMFFSIVEDDTITRSLDIGTATGRYPLLLAKRGIQAYGLDNGPEALNYARSKLPDDAEWPRFIEGDARSLSFTDTPLDLVTCMMGTFGHISPEAHEQVIGQIVELLGSGGRLVVSTWDIECDHLAYLSMYTETQKELIRAQSPTRQVLYEMVEHAGLQNVTVHPFGMFPSLVVYDLALANMSRKDIEIVVDMDLAARSLFPRRHGQMYMVTGTKGS